METQKVVPVSKIKPSYLSDFPTRLAAIRVEKGLTQKALSDLLGVTQGAVAHWERADADPKLSTLLKLAAALGCRVVDLVGED